MFMVKQLMPKTGRYAKMSLWDKNIAGRMFQELPFFNMEIKILKNIDLLHCKS